MSSASTTVALDDIQNDIARKDAAQNAPRSGRGTRPDILAGLLAYSWRGIRFPSAGFNIRLRQDLVIHDYAGRDGAHVEATGRAPLEFSARIPFRNGVERARHEDASQPLYPTIFRQFLNACADRSTGDMVHPELGRVPCKVQSAEIVYDAQKRDGVDVDVTWIEATDTVSELQEILSKRSPVQQLAESAHDADAALDAITEKLSKKNKDTDKAVRAYVKDLKSTELKNGSLSQFARRVQAVGDQADLAHRQGAAAAASLEYKARNIVSSLDRARTPAVYWPLQEAATRLQVAAAELRDSLRSGGRTLGVYVLGADMTLAGAAQEIPARIDDVLKLNPQLAASPVILSGTRVKYFVDGRR